MMNRIPSAIVAVILAMSVLTACASGTKVPDVAGSDIETAKAVIAALGLVPAIEEETSETVEAGTVINTDPVAGESLSPGSKVSVLVSKGQKRVDAKDATIEWISVASGKDDWNFTSPYIEDGTMYIEFSDVKLMAEVKWKDPYKRGNGFGHASINDTFDKSVPVNVLYDKQSHKYGQKQNFTVKVPVSDLDEQRPTTMYLKLVAFINGVESDINVTLTATW